MIPLTNYDFQWGRSEVVIIYPDRYVSRSHKFYIGQSIWSRDSATDPSCHPYTKITYVWLGALGTKCSPKLERKRLNWILPLSIWSSLRFLSWSKSRYGYIMYDSMYIYIITEMGVSWNRDAPKSSISIGFSIANNPAIGVPPFPQSGPHQRPWVPWADLRPHPRCPGHHDPQWAWPPALAVSEKEDIMGIHGIIYIYVYI